MKFSPRPQDCQQAISDRVCALNTGIDHLLETRALSRLEPREAGDRKASQHRVPDNLTVAFPISFDTFTTIHGSPENSGASPRAHARVRIVKERKEKKKKKTKDGMVTISPRARRRRMNGGTHKLGRREISGFTCLRLSCSCSCS